MKKIIWRNPIENAGQFLIRRNIFFYPIGALPCLASFSNVLDRFIKSAALIVTPIPFAFATGGMGVSLGAHLFQEIYHKPPSAKVKERVSRHNRAVCVGAYCGFVLVSQTMKSVGPGTAQAYEVVAGG